MRDLLDWLELTREQSEAVQDRGEALLVAAGAGTGKTRTLVARYLSLLAEGVSPREIAAITFTEKAAREMRNRIRSRIADWVGELGTGPERQRWLRWLRVMESARIGTIHSLCAEILRAHPAEAVIDPQFEVVDEGTSALLRAEAVDGALAAAANDAELAPLYRDFSVWGLRRLLSRMLEKRLDVSEAMVSEGRETGKGEGPVSAVVERLRSFRSQEEVVRAIEGLRSLRAEGYFDGTATATMAEMVEGLLSWWDRFERALEAAQEIEAAQALFAVRREYLRGGVGRRDGPARPLIDALQEYYDQSINPWLGGARAADAPPDEALEARYREIHPRLGRLFGLARGSYEGALAQRHALDFDGLEAGALELLQDEFVRGQWRDKVRHVLVDEFQDTNGRQRRIVQALTESSPGTLFVVGDARQSIYRFRGAEVAVFRQLEEELAKRGGARRLRRTFRQHRPLLAQLDRLLPQVMDVGSAGALYETPYQQLRTERDPAPDLRRPYVEFVIGVGENADDGRATAADALAGRLREMKAKGDFSNWSEVALLFRASSGFSQYEDAFEAHGIPYVTVAGRGFYERPEIRETLNALRALAEPWNDAAVVGLLRSVMVGMSDPAIYELRVGPSGPRSLHEALWDEGITLSPEDEDARARARHLLDVLVPRVDRLTVYDMLKVLLDEADARAALAIAGQRQWGNLDKLLEDARTSQTTRIRGFLEYLQATREAGVREGEAAAEGQGALRLMTVHKSKGLEFPVVVLADAGYAGRSSSEPAYVSEEWGLTFRPDLWEGTSMAYGLARGEDAAREEAEEGRLLYVAATRARDKLVISGHMTEGVHGLRCYGWLGGLLAAAGAKPDEVEPGVSEQESPVEHRRLLLMESLGAPEVATEEKPVWPREAGSPLYPPVRREEAEGTDANLDEEPARDWRATARKYPPASAVGVLVHRALERWLFPPDAALDRLLLVSALGEGLVDREQREAAIDRALLLLTRLAEHPLWAEIERSGERYHELPYTFQPPKGPPDSGAFDLLYRRNGSWRLVDFKTDDINTPEDLRIAIEGEGIERGYRRQLERYRLAATALFGEKVRTSIVFLDNQDEVTEIPIGPH